MIDHNVLKRVYVYTTCKIFQARHIILMIIFVQWQSKLGDGIGLVWARSGR
jgi:hypothetical protein